VRIHQIITDQSAGNVQKKTRLGCLARRGELRFSAIVI